MKEEHTMFHKQLEYLMHTFPLFNTFISSITMEKICKINNIPFIFTQFLIYKHVYLYDNIYDLSKIIDLHFIEEIEISTKYINNKLCDYIELEYYFIEYLDYLLDNKTQLNEFYLPQNPFINNYSTNSRNIQ